MKRQTTKNMKKGFIIVWSVLSFTAYAQVEKNVGQVEINVIDQYKASVKSAVKISGQPDFKDTTTKKLPVNYTVKSKNLTFEYTPSPIPPARLAKTRLTKLPQNLVTLGFGTAVTPFFEIYTGSSRSNTSGWGAHGRYFYTEGGVKGTIFKKAPFREADVELYYKKLFKKYRFNAKVDADFDTYSYYGILKDPKTVDLGLGEGNNPELHKYNRMGGKVEFGSIDPDTKAIFNRASASYFFMKDNYNTVENELYIPTKWLIPAQGENFFTELNVGYQGTKFGIDSVNTAIGDTGSAPSFLHVQFMPKIKSQYGKLFFTVGLNINTNTENKTSEFSEGKTRVYFYPELTADVDLVPSVLSVYAGWTGKLQNNSVWSLKEQNNFIEPYVPLQATSTHHIFIGFKGPIAKMLSYNLGAKYDLVSDMAIFYRDPNLYYNVQKGFTVLYDNAQVMGLQGEIKFENDKGVTVAVSGEYNKYKMKNLKYAYHRPNAQVGIWASYNWREKIITSVNINYVGERIAFDPDVAPPPYKNSSHNHIMGDYLDARLGAEYLFNSNLSASLNVTNLFLQDYQAWYGYPVQQIRLLMALSYRF